MFKNLGSVIKHASGNVQNNLILTSDELTLKNHTTAMEAQKNIKLLAVL
jgi:hypothetical protein